MTNTVNGAAVQQPTIKKEEPRRRNMAPLPQK